MKTKKEKLRAVLSHIICDTTCVLNVIKEIQTGFSTKFRIEINNEDESMGSRSNHYVLIGLSGLSKMYDICNKFFSRYIFDYNTCRIPVLHCDKDINIDIWDLDDSIFPDSFLDGENIGPVDSLVINAFAYTLYHEFGHVKYDEDSKPPMEKEWKADLFAMEVIKADLSSKPNVQIDKNPIFLGALFEFIHILNISSFYDLQVDMSHPHPIERLYLLLEYFHIENNSYLWEYVYDEISQWLNANHMLMTYEKFNSISIKDKFLDAYHRFKK